MDDKVIRRLRLMAEISRADGRDIDAAASGDIFAALAELARLRAEVERLTQERDAAVKIAVASRRDWLTDVWAKVKAGGLDAGDNAGAAGREG
jgi:transposase-like protein